MRLKDPSTALAQIQRASRKPAALEFMHPKRFGAVLGALLASCCGWGLVQAQFIIVNDDVAISSIDRNRARLIFTMRINQWSDQQPVAVFVLPDQAPLHQEFAKSALGVFPFQLRQTWDRQVFSGTGQAPLQVASEAEMIQRVSQTPGAIGYVEQPPDLPGIKVIEVE